MKALIVIDMQKGFLHDCKHKKLIDRVNRLIISGCYDKTIFTKFINDSSKNEFYGTKINWNGLKNDEEQEILVSVPKNAFVFEKNGYGIDQKDLKKLKQLKIKEIDVCGVDADACVYAIALQLWDAGIYPNILINYVECDEKFKDAIQEIYIKQFGKVDNRK